MVLDITSKNTSDMKLNMPVYITLNKTSYMIADMTTDMTSYKTEDMPLYMSLYINSDMTLDVTLVLH